MKRIAVLLVVICILPALVYAQAIAYDYSKLYEALSPAVVQITTQDGSGSGFVVTPFGHIATNFQRFAISGSAIPRWAQGQSFGGSSESSLRHGAAQGEQ